ncbi:hypothetical protein HG264_01055 [Pseudomonas sp. gcc21]|uniref:hypothetical protein n=1 Tax=Pseudomonas sp. gcc21 TaxID=2726989 RepID=UPI0014515C31|nr:hypothetical protein [Pseudomonas sp. gcc21]QJD57594.1 hypothetical protein HG264_01055 [Pseudomonas sp. gcc21]
MKHLIGLIQTKPQWLNNEGYWRILQILRFVAAAPPALIAIGVFFVVAFDSPDFFYFVYVPVWLGVSAAAFWGVHAIAWAYAWVTDGFTQTKGKAQ